VRRPRESFVAALEAALVVGRAAGVMDRVLDATPTAPPAARPPDILDALVTLRTRGHRAGVPALRQVLAGPDSDWTAIPGLATLIAGELWDLDLHTRVTEWLVRQGQDTGSPLAARAGQSQSAMGAVLTGRFGHAMAAIAEEEAIAAALGDVPQMYPRVHLAALRGRHAEALALFDDVQRRGTGQLTANVHWAKAVLYNGLGDYPAALQAAEEVIAAGDLFLAGAALPEAVEAAARSGKDPAAESALAALVERAEAADTDWAQGVMLGARALLSEAEDDHREAVERLDRSPFAPYAARARLRYGEWLRREGRRRDARENLRTAHEQLSEIGMEAFAQRAAHELRATGEVVAKRSQPAYDHLTMQEMHIARHVAAGATSKEVAARLYLSPRTVEAHLRNIFRKLDITSRRQLKAIPEIA
jgi:DNA-binding CsgD family transcriptional regulator